jgi:FG-GAP repeat
MGHLASRMIPVLVLTWGAAPLQADVINEDLKLVASDGAIYDYFGWSVALDSGVVAVGAENDDDNGFDSGAAYLLDVTTGAQLDKLVPSDSAIEDFFGWSIAIDDGVVVAVGAYRDDDNGSNSGSAYLFNATTGLEITKLIAGDGAADDEFGYSIAISDSVVAVGAWGDDDNGSNSGSAYLFDVITGTEIAKLLPSDGAAGDRFGCSIAIDDGVVAVGAYRSSDHGQFSGSAYLFDVATGAQVAKLLPSDGAEGKEFGCSIAIEGGIVAIGASGDSANGYGAGAAYLFDAVSGTQSAKLIASDGAALDNFGYSIDIDGDAVAIGARWDDDMGGGSGSAYFFDATTGAEIAKLLASDGEAQDYFGWSIAVDDGVIVVGAPQDGNQNGGFAGSAYLFNVSSTPCLGDLDGDGDTDQSDLGILLASYEVDGAGDLDGDGDTDQSDLGILLADYDCGT